MKTLRQILDEVGKTKRTLMFSRHAAYMADNYTSYTAQEFAATCSDDILDAPATVSLMGTIDGDFEGILKIDYTTKTIV